MFIDINELEIRPLEFDEEFRPAIIDFGPDVRQVRLLSTRGRAELLQEHRAGRGLTVKDIRLVGSLNTGVEIVCARCLEPVQIEVRRDLDLLYRPQGVDAGHEELSVTDAEAEIGYYTGDGLELEEVLREQVLLSLPLKVLCRQDCKGLCSQCGKNLNEGPCLCTPPPDPRWLAIEDLKNKLQ